jgi:hypothetical protein
VVHLGRVIAEADHIRSSQSGTFSCGLDSRRFCAMNSVDVVENVQKERWSIITNQRYYIFGASEATIFSKRESARSASHCGLNFSSP